jgi:hypothetical protein
VNLGTPDFPRFFLAVGLHSLPGYEKFYDNRGMYDLGSDEDVDELVYFEYGLWRQRLQGNDN